jgi:hypothetical protein
MIYAIELFYVLPVTKLTHKAVEPVTPYQIFLDNIPRSIHFRVFGCPHVTNKSTTTHPRGKVTKNTTTVVKMVYELFSLDSIPINKYVWSIPQSNRIALSNDCYFAETFLNILCRTWIPFSYTIALG